MKPIALTFIVSSVILLSGCATNRSPLEPYPKQGGATVRSAATMAVGTAAGAAAGAALADNKEAGAAAGAAVGLISSALLSRHMSKKQAETEAEAYERGRREANVELMQKYWHQQTLAPRDESESGEATKPREIHYPQGTYEGIRFGPRVTSAPVLAEPRR